MWKLIASLILSTSVVYGMDLLSYKGTGTKLHSYNDTEIESLWSSSKAVCLKDGAKIIGVNRKFKEMRLGYRDCSNGEAAERKAKALGYEVIVVKLAELSDNKIKSVLSKN